MVRETQHHLFTALLTHDISNFNQTTRGYLEMLLDEQMGTLSEDQARALTTCLRQCQRVQRVIDGIRLMERLAQEPPRPTPIDLDRAIRAAIGAVQREQADRDVRVRFASAGRKARAEDHLQEVFRQLIGNSARHSESEVVEVEIEVHRRDGDHPTWEIVISDNGTGVPLAKRPSLFNRLECEDVHGAGIGLSLVKTLLARWGGSIHLEDTPPGQGAVLTVSIPAL